MSPEEPQTYCAEFREAAVELANVYRHAGKIKVVPLREMATRYLKK
jgi:hypothetical protein